MSGESIAKWVAEAVGVSAPISLALAEDGERQVEVVEARLGGVTQADDIHDRIDDRLREGNCVGNCAAELASESDDVDSVGGVGIGGWAAVVAGPIVGADVVDLGCVDHVARVGDVDPLAKDAFELARCTAGHAIGLVIPLNKSNDICVGVRASRNQEPHNNQLHLKPIS